MRCLERPRAVAGDLHGDDVVRPRERFDHALRGGDRNRVLARAPAEHDGDAAARPGHLTGVVAVTVAVVVLVVVVVVSVGSVSAPPAVRLPTVIVTTPPFVSGVPPSGSCASTTPSVAGSVTSCVAVATSNPAPCRSASASDWVCRVTSGTCEVDGPFETWSVTFVPAGTGVPATGCWATTMPFGSSESTSTRSTLNPAPLSAPNAFAYGWPTTFVTGTGFGPRETLIRTVDPRSTRSPAAGNWPITVSSFAVEKM